MSDDVSMESGTSRPTKSFAGGCFFTLFGIPFFGMGLLAAYQGVLGVLGLPTSLSEDSLTGVPLIMFGGIFALVGLLIMIGGVYSLFGWGRPSNRPSKLNKAAWACGYPSARRRAQRTHRGIRLYARGGGWGSLVVLLIFALFWNGISFPVLITMIREEGLGFPMVCFLLFPVVGLVLIGAVIHQFSKLAYTGQTRVFVSRELVEAGRPLDFEICQPGNYPIHKVSVTLMMKERVTYRQGTSTASTEREIWTMPVAEEVSLRAAGDRPIVRGTIEIPTTAMHSFKSGNNEVYWGLEVQMDIPGRVDVKDFFSFRVLPRGIPPHVMSELEIREVAS